MAGADYPIPGAPRAPDAPHVPAGAKPDVSDAAAIAFGRQLLGIQTAGYGGGGQGGSHIRTVSRMEDLRLAVAESMRLMRRGQNSIAEEGLLGGEVRWS